MSETFKIGCLADGFRTDVRSALKKAKALGLQGVQVYATGGEVSPDMTSAQRREFVDFVKSNGLVLSALCGEIGSFADPQDRAQKIELSRRILDLAVELGTNIVTTHVGTIPEDKNNKDYEMIQSACYELAQYADSMNAHFALETGKETCVVLKEFLDTLGSTGVAVNFDPANLWMCIQDDPVAGVYTLKDYIVHTHAKDGVPDPTARWGWRELPLGEGGVDFPNYLKALKEIGYRGFLTIEREVGEKPEEDIAHAANFLRRTISENAL